jgi:hypothetical protein
MENRFDSVQRYVAGLDDELNQQSMEQLMRERGNEIRESFRPLIDQLKIDLARQKTEGAKERVKERVLDMVAAQLRIIVSASDEGSGNYQVMMEILDELLNQK